MFLKKVSKADISLGVAVLNDKLPPLLQIPRGQTLPWAVTALLLALGMQLALLSITPPKRKTLDKRLTRTASLGVEPEFSTALDLLIQPRLEAPALRSEWQELVEESKAAAAKGDVDAAIQLLEEAEGQAPRQPAALAEIAVQLEKCQAPARALKIWEKIHQFGISAGVYYSAADAKLSLLQAKTAEESKSDSGAMSKSAVLRFTKLTTREHVGSYAARRNFTLEVPVQRNTSKEIQVRDVSVQVQFYEQINGRTLERTNAAIRWKWGTSPVDWQSEANEILEVDYKQSPVQSPGEERRFFGYVASIYYKDKLIDIRAEPSRLGQQYPPPRLLPRDPAP